MSVFEDLVMACRSATEAEISDMAGGDWTDAAFAVADTVFQTVEATLPAVADKAWCLGILAERSDLFDADPDGETLADAVRNAVRDLIVEEIEADMLVHARSIGLDIPDSVSPSP